MVGQKLYVICILILLFNMCSVFAEEPPITERQFNIFRGELLKQLDDTKTAIIEEANKNNDANFQLLDQRNSDFIGSLKMKIIVGVLGLNFFVVSLMGFVFNMIHKKNSIIQYEKDIRSRFPDHQLMPPSQIPQAINQPAVSEPYMPQQQSYPEQQVYQESQPVYQEQYPQYPQYPEQNQQIYPQPQQPMYPEQQQYPEQYPQQPMYPEQQLYQDMVQQFNPQKYPYQQ